MSIYTYVYVTRRWKQYHPLTNPHFGELYRVIFAPHLPPPWFENLRISGESRSTRVCCVTHQTCLSSHSRHSCCIAQPTCLCVRQQASLLRRTANISAAIQRRHVCCVKADAIYSQATRPIVPTKGRTIRSPDV